MTELSLQPQPGNALAGQYKADTIEQLATIRSAIEAGTSIANPVNAGTSADAGHWPISKALARLLEQLYRHGRERAIASHALEARQEDLEYLSHYAEAEVIGFHGDAFDPQTHQHDQWRKDNFDLHWKERLRVDAAVKFARAAVGEAAAKLAALQHADTMPQWPLAVTVAGVVLLCILAGITLHDFLAPAFRDEAISWSVSLLGGACFALFITVGMAVTSSLGGNLSRQNRTANHLMLAGGVGLAVSLGALRIGQDQSIGSILIACALTGVEIFCLLYLKGVGAQMYDAFHHWQSRQTELAAAQASLDAQRARLARWEQEFTRIEQRLGEIVMYVEDRAQRNTDPIELKTAAIKAVHNGYFAGLAANHQRVFGG